MQHVRHLSVAAMVAAFALMFSPAAARAQTHLDRVEIRRIVRHMEEHNDALRDRIETWIAERPGEREHRADEIAHACDHLDEVLTQFKTDLRAHDEPWELRDEAQTVLSATADVGHKIEESESREAFHSEWEALRDEANNLARRYHLPEIGHHE